MKKDGIQVSIPMKYSVYQVYTLICNVICKVYLYLPRNCLQHILNWYPLFINQSEVLAQTWQVKIVINASLYKHNSKEKKGIRVDPLFRFFIFSLDSYLIFFKHRNIHVCLFLPIIIHGAMIYITLIRIIFFKTK